MHYMKKNNYIHDYILKIHTKTSDVFRDATLTKLIGNESIFLNNIKNVMKDGIGMISGNNILNIRNHRHSFKNNFYHLRNLIRFVHNEDMSEPHLEFCAGTMFLFKFIIFDILPLEKIEVLYKQLNTIETLDYSWYSQFYKINISNHELMKNDFNNHKKRRHPNNLSYSFYTKKDGLRDCMIEHAMERLFGYMCKRGNLRII